MNTFVSLILILVVSRVDAVPDVSRVACSTTKGPFVVEVYRDWAPLGADRFLELVEDSFYTDIPLYRCVKGFLTQFGITDDDSKKHWHGNQIKDDPSQNRGIKKHFLSFAGGGPDTRSTQIFIAFEDLDFLGEASWEVPFGRIVSGSEAVDALYTGYGDIHPYGRGPDQQTLYKRGNAYIREDFPLIDFIESCWVITDPDEEL